ncbi:MAG: DUF1992 domain-containing protein [Betaproteobacteria bacterium]|nr:DUF1992 domain-containing protein [Betaproteobacteria bacterium]
MHILNILAEQKISAAAAKGVFDALPGAGRALDFGDELLVPDETWAIYRVLKNSGFLPPEIERMRERDRLRKRLAQLSSGDNEQKILRGRLLAIELALTAGRGSGLNVPYVYREKVLAKFSGLSQPERESYAPQDDPDVGVIHKE